MCLKGIGVYGVFVHPAQSKVVLVVVSFMRGMTVAVVKVVDMLVMLDRRVAAVGAVLVFVPLGLEVPTARDPTAQGAV